MNNGPWKLSDLDKVKKNGLKVFSCFHCGGGSTMGYKLAGFDVLGGVEIDKNMMAIYRENHRPKYSYLMPVQEFKNIPDKDLPQELFNLDILDGSPPCSSFSMAGSREKKWGAAHAFREGQSVQVLDDLFFHFIDIAKKLKPKVVVSENVKGLIQGNARGYVKEIFSSFKAAGYETQLFLLNSSRMGVPQARERTFFISNRIDKKIKLEFNEKPIAISEALNGVNSVGRIEPTTTQCFKYWSQCAIGSSFSTVHPTGSYFSKIRIDPRKPVNTITGHSKNDLFHWDTCASLSNEFFIRAQTFPDDYNFLLEDPGYVCGMSVPPYMMERIASQIAIQLFNR